MRYSPIAFVKRLIGRVLAVVMNSRIARDATYTPAIFIAGLTTPPDGIRITFAVSVPPAMTILENIQTTIRTSSGDYLVTFATAGLNNAKIAFTDIVPLTRKPCEPTTETNSAVSERSDLEGYSVQSS